MKKQILICTLMFFLVIFSRPAFADDDVIDEIDDIETYADYGITWNLERDVLHCTWDNIPDNASLIVVENNVQRLNNVPASAGGFDLTLNDGLYDIYIGMALNGGGYKVIDRQQFEVKYQSSVQTNTNEVQSYFNQIFELASRRWDFGFIKFSVIDITIASFVFSLIGFVIYKFSD